MMRFLLFITLILAGCQNERPAPIQENTLPDIPYVTILGIGQDGGKPQAGSHSDPAWKDPSLRRLAVSLGLVEPSSDKRWMFEATPDFRQQLYDLDQLAGPRKTTVPDGIFLTHGHIGHYTGLMFLGNESIGAQDVKVYAMPKMRDYLSTSGPWSQLVDYENILLEPLSHLEPVVLTDQVTVTPFLVPHRQEYTEVVGYIIEGPTRRIGFIPDIDAWELWDTGLKAFLADVDVALVDGSFFADGELPGRDMSKIPHPWTTHTMNLLADADAETRAKVMFIHFNHTNPVLLEDSPETAQVLAAGFNIARRGDILEL
ncbi:MAG: pyrroloquinoline quinone biosynthesis protein PqqB [Bacteroidetes Order II. Incertae sedis bacterium]|jgi:pyrroloquinoline quinone biosynthesis protein B|nr:pyrroloquinoline quinone biosynthesis protein PqqB [Bacteroidetes Order II. bacterium]MBT4052267.1 pyrroloquinoline quinone biosynthesis protein PqqB [Bacteroidetes Order II. bacterium]MBT4602807.1 pyrroloquinoline quinone biosynthesis protein PqqB [Bacteroidetes Order II. bacterium]MBT5248732.1 pyrroloquinoline quinone biosynthesis protein PqqB [Bacteroidetes Order II. bacterium]MBT6201602.1 pyrroloquinoline quinone biosynthesis protein PqqB [Bacteroidetes Order II. bacterium]